MTIPTSTVGFNDINLELREAAGATCSINNTCPRTIAGVASGQISLSDFRGKKLAGQDDSSWNDTSASGIGVAFNFTVPACVKYISAICKGRGGSGGGCNSASAGSGGGGGGAGGGTASRGGGSIGGANNLASHGMLILENGVFKGAWGGGSLRTPGDVRGTIFYDWDNTAYYVDPASGERIYSSTIGGYGASTATGDGSGQLQIINGGGTGDSNVAAIAFHCSGAYAAKLHLRADGYFGYGGWSAAAWRWYVNGSGDMTAAGNVTAYSDPRLKEDVTVIKDSLEKITKLSGVKFRWKDISELGKPGTYDYGILSTDVEKIAPELVTSSAITSPEGDRYKTVAYDKLIPFLIEAIKEQQKIIDNQNSRLAKLEEQLTQLLNKTII